MLIFTWIWSHKRNLLCHVTQNVVKRSIPFDGSLWTPFPLYEYGCFSYLLYEHVEEEKEIKHLTILGNNMGRLRIILSKICCLINTYSIGFHFSIFFFIAWEFHTKLLHIAIITPPYTKYSPILNTLKSFHTHLPSKCVTTSFIFL